MPGTGAEFARHALDQLKLHDVKVEPTELGNHYDPDARAVRLEPRFMSGKSLISIVTGFRCVFFLNGFFFDCQNGGRKKTQKKCIWSKL